jgi:Bifunctional DNA primase/polymerase, N-terminal
MFQDDPACREMLIAALALAAAGLAVFPAVYRTKEPATKRGFYDASTNLATVRRWFGGNYRRNLAVRTGLASGAWVLDVDDPDALTALEDRFGPLPATRRSQSRRGSHLWFKASSVSIPCSAGRVAPGVDVKAEGGYVLAPPSIHPDGPAYGWVNDNPIVEAPAWLAGLAKKRPPPPPRSEAPRAYCGRPSAYGAAALKAEVDILANTPPGNRNHQLNRASLCLHQLIAGGELGAGEVERALIEAATVNGLVKEDGLRQCMATIRSGARAGLQYPRSRPGSA